MESIIGKTIKEINVLLSIWVTSIRLNTSINYTDANIDAENVACGLHIYQKTTEREVADTH